MRWPESSKRNRPANANGSPRSAIRTATDPAVFPRLLFDARFVDQHDRNVIANGINALAFDAFEAVFVLFELHRSLTKRADENLQQILTDGHNSVFSVTSAATPKRKS